VQSGTTVNLSPRRAFIQCTLAVVLIWAALPVRAFPAESYGDSVVVPVAASSQSNITRQLLVPSASFAKKSEKGGGGGSNNSGKDEDKDDKKDKKDKKDKDGKKDKDDKKDKKDKKDK
jgi:hypothetical protein